MAKLSLYNCKIKEIKIRKQIDLNKPRIPLLNVEKFGV